MVEGNDISVRKTLVMRSRTQTEGRACDYYQRGDNIATFYRISRSYLRLTAPNASCMRRYKLSHRLQVNLVVDQLLTS